MKRQTLLLSLLLIVLLSACANKLPGAKITKEIWPYELYNKLNLRTLVSRYNNGLRYYCASYPKDFFRPDQVYMPNTDKIIMENNETLLSFEFITNEQIILVYEKKDGSYKSKEAHTIYYNEAHDDYRVNNFYIKKRKDCVKYVIPQDNNETKEQSPKK